MALVLGCLSPFAAARAQVVISEFAAENDTGLADDNGDRADWIELFNASTGAVNLAGWHLTDDADEPAKWTFPAAILAPQQFLVVFASDKDRTNWPGTLHANFKLDAGGEYLALVRPDGTDAHRFAPAFPPQSGDISFGLPMAQQEVTLLAEGSPCFTRTAGTGIVPLGWIVATGADDNAWSPGVSGVGFDLQPTYAPLIGMNLQAAMYPTATLQQIRIPMVLSNLPPLGGLWLDMMYDDGFVAWLNGRQIAITNAPVPVGSMFLLQSKATAGHADSLATNFETFAASAAITNLVNGSNLLAIAGLNLATNDDDFLILPRLRGTAQVVTDLTPLYFAQPSPGSVNTGAYAGAVANAKFSVDRGFFTQAFAVTVSCATAAATLVCTVDGSTPSLTNGQPTTGIGTNGPCVTLVITNTTVLRARAFVTGWPPPATDTKTYLFPASVLHQPAGPAGYPTQWMESGGAAYPADYAMDPRIVTNAAYSNKMAGALLSLPTLSLVTDVPNLFDRYTGIYANPLMATTNWERAVSVEWMDPATSNNWQINAGLRIQGGYFRQQSATRKHSFRLVFRGQYGEPALNTRFFDEPGATARFDSITLRAQGNDGYSWSAAGVNVLYLRDQFGRELLRDVGQLAPHGNYVHLYLNGLYWGLYNPVEHADESFSAAYFGGEKTTWDSINSGELINGSMDAWNALVAQCQAGMTSLTNYLRVQGRNPDGTPNPSYPNYLEVDNCIDYMMVNLWGGNWDWPFKNYWVGRNRAGTAGFRFYLWDYEDTVGTPRSPLTFQASASGGVATPHQYLVQSAEYRLRFADHIQKHFFTRALFAPTNLIARFTNLAARIAAAMPAESARWGDQSTSTPHTAAQWEAMRDSIAASYLPYRTDVAMTQFRNAGLYPATAAPVFGRPGGLVPPGYALTLTAACRTVVFTLDGTDPRQVGTGAATGTFYTNALVLDRSCLVRARALTNGVWSALVEYPFVVDAPSSLRISEVMYRAREPDAAEAAAGFTARDFDFIEVHNAGGAPAGWTGYALTGGAQFDFTRTNLGSLAGGAYALVVRNPAAFAMRHGTGAAAQVVGVYSNDLKDGGEGLALERPLTGERLSFAYSGGAGWPASTAGAGHSLVPLAEDDATGHRLNYGGNWRASAFRDGSPGAPDPEPVTDLLLNEIAANTVVNEPGHDSNDWIELFNASTGGVGFAGWYLSDDAADLARWALPSNGSLPAAAWTTFEEIGGFHADTNAGFGLASAGETLFLSYLPAGAPGRVADAKKFGGQDRDVTLGRHPDGQPWWSAMPPTPGASNRLAAAPVVISEIMFHPPDTNAPAQDNVRDEYIELFNAAAAPVALAASGGAWRIAGSVDLALPAGLTLAAGERVLAVSFDPADAAQRAAFAAASGLAGDAPRVFGPYAGSLPNDTGRIALEYPVAPHTPGDPPVWVAVDEAIYFDDQPWTRGADGNGLALHRVNVSGHACDPAGWRAGVPSGGDGTIDLPPLRLGIATAENGGARIVWPSRSGLVYKLEATVGPGSPWTPAGEVQAVGPTSGVWLLDASPTLLFRGQQRDR